LKALRNVAITTVIYMGSMLAAKAVVERTLVAYRNYTYPAVNLADKIGVGIVWFTIVKELYYAFTDENTKIRQILPTRNK
jgi:hypothetical protein